MGRDLLPLYGFAGVGDFANLHMDPTEYDQAISDYGIGCELRRGVLCPCARIETHGARANCQLCGGNGWLWPKDYREDIVALVLSRRPHTNEEAAGSVVTGQVQISFPVGIVPGEWDMVLPSNERHVVHQVIHRESLQEDPREAWERTTNPTARPPKVKPLVDRLLYPDADIERCFWLIEDPEHPKKRLLCRGLPNTDFRIVDGAVEWLHGRGPQPGRAYTLRYTAPAAYVLLPGDAKWRSDAEDTLPYQATGIRLDRWGFPDVRDL